MYRDPKTQESGVKAANGWCRVFMKDDLTQLIYAATVLSKSESPASRTVMTLG
jgi:hypothetical protein